MKIRIQDSSVRFRLTLREVERLAAEGLLSSTMQVLGPAGPAGVFEYRIEHDPSATESVVVIQEGGITLRLCGADRVALMREDQEGVYLRREWVAPDGTTLRFLAFVEKDRPASTCRKIEAWIYDAPPRGEAETRPIPGRAS